VYRNIINNVDHVVQHRVPRCWSILWKIKLPLKVKNFLWRVCWDSLPTRLRLQGHGVPCPMMCAICNEHDEDNAHMFFDCPNSIRCWQRMELWQAIQLVWQNTSSCSTNIIAILQNLYNYQKQRFGVTLWSIWKNINNKIWENDAETAEQICGRAEAFLNSWWNAQEMRHQGANSTVQN
jgi:hypothetical protein